ncbi:hypothetical protein FGIG_05878 [Fasciola gigantica]|uniref:Uncharacterized protein n=1 Tax=Fasciola gigantica TaxID=46835 RepID=A0A504Z2Z9_FASGI|nr:hypothetical protein FGIG_05878 [Fasciola gigantica]
MHLSSGIVCREKAARKQDLIRMENELEMQIQRYEERAKNEVQDRIRSEYDTMINAKEKEIAEIRSQVEMLKSRIQSGEEQQPARTAPDSTTMDQTTLLRTYHSTHSLAVCTKSVTNSKFHGSRSFGGRVTTVGQS